MAKRAVPEIPAASMADIAFMLLIFFLVATTMDSTKGLFRMLPPMIKDNNEPPIKILDKNLFVVLVNKDDKLMVEKKPMDVRDLRKSTKEFLLNMNKNFEDLQYPDYEEVNIKEIGLTKVTKAVISIQNDRGTSYGKYIEIQNEIVAAYNEVKDLYSVRYFNKSFNQLSDDEQKLIQQVIPQRISEAEPKNIGGN